MFQRTLAQTLVIGLFDEELERLSAGQPLPGCPRPRSFSAFKPPG